MNPCAIVNALYNLQIIIIITGIFQLTFEYSGSCYICVVVVAVVATARGRLLVECPQASIKFYLPCQLLLLLLPLHTHV